MVFEHYEIWIAACLGSLVGLKFAEQKSLVNKAIDVVNSIIIGLYLTRFVAYSLVFTTKYLEAVAFFCALFSLDIVNNLKKSIKDNFIEKQIDKTVDKILTVFDFFKGKK